MLSTQERKCYEMTHGEGYSFAYVGSLLGIETGTVGSYVKRAEVKISNSVGCKLVLEFVGE